MSPGVPASVGVAIPTVYLRETVASPCKNNDPASIPLVDVDVSLLLKTTGPSNSEMMFAFGPHSTLNDLLIDASSGVRTSNPMLIPPYGFNRLSVFEAKTDASHPVASERLRHFPKPFAQF